ncbi:protein kinase domain-containing protein [Actinophytocola sp.]|uniref:protein kinase domain-containing protein n=1 Tax=Actinophytocola sp. TaxID=1872138 RepID=UPI002ED16C7D
MERALGSRYRLGEPLGSGAMGQVFAGTDPEGQEFAFKILRSDLTGNPDVVARFLKERSILVGLRHGNLVGVHDLVVEGDTVAIVMDLVRGGDLRARLADGPLLPSEVARIGASVASALAAVHAAGVVHRDVKPENILMDGMTPKLTDFGISRLARDSEIGRSSLLAGTPQYVAPELAEGLDATPAADLYSLGIVLYELCCGVTPFAGGSMLTVIRQHAEQEPGRPGGIPDQLWEVISWLLRKSPRGRPQTAQQVATLLDALAPELLAFPVAQRLTAPPAPAPAPGQFTTQMGMAPTGHGPVMPAGMVAPPPAKRRRKGWLVAVPLVLVLVGGAGAYVALRPTGNEGSGGASAAGEGGGGTANEDPGTSSARVTTTTEEQELTVAPDLVGMELAEAQDRLPSTLEVEIVDSIQQGAEPGTVVEQDPKAGEPLDGTLKLVVAQDAVQMYLDEFPVLNGDWSDNSGPASIAGKTYLHSLSSYISCYDDGGQAEYNIAKGFRRLVATAALDDNSQIADATMQLEIFADGRSVFSGTIAYGTPTPIDLDLSGVLRLKFQWRVLQEACGDRTLVIGEAKLFGLPGEVPTTAPTS